MLLLLMDHIATQESCPFVWCGVFRSVAANTVFELVRKVVESGRR